MKNILLKASVIPIALSVLLAFGAAASADSITGDLSTGLNANNGSGLDGTVVAPPTADPGTGAYSGTQSVTLSAAGSASIVYTTDGTSPECGTSTAYGGSISVSSSEIIEAVACYQGSSNIIPSTIASFGYIISAAQNNSNDGGGGGGGGGGSSSNVVGGGISGGGGSIGSGSGFNIADINHDGRVDILDFVALMADWGQTGPNLPGDLNHDGVVDIQDFVILMANWSN